MVCECASTLTACCSSTFCRLSYLKLIQDFTSFSNPTHPQPASRQHPPSDVPKPVGPSLDARPLNSERRPRLHT